MRLAGQGGWIHANCAMWSAEVYENKMDNSYQLLNVHAAISRGNVCTCTFCGKNGATVGCVRNTAEFCGQSSLSLTVPGPNVRR